MLQLLLFMVLMLMVFGECIVIGDNGIECSECGCGRCGVGGRSGVCGGESVCVVVSFKYSFIGSVSFTRVFVGVNVGEEDLR